MEKNREKLIQEYKAKKEKERKEHPERFVPKWSYELFGIECGDGWKPLYQPIIDYINKYNEDKTDENRIEIHQVKEKFGGLRIYLSCYTEELRDMIREAEEKSFNTCETCGKHIEKPITEGHWIYAECQECHDKWKQERQRQIDAVTKKIKKKKDINSENSKD